MRVVIIDEKAQKIPVAVISPRFLFSIFISCAGVTAYVETGARLGRLKKKGKTCEYRGEGVSLIAITLEEHLQVLTY